MGIGGLGMKSSAGRSPRSDRGASRRAGHLDAELGARLRAARSAAGLSLEELAGRVELSVQQIHKYESGTNRIAVSRLLEICDALNIEFSALLRSGNSYVGGAGATPEELAALITRFSALRDPASRKQVLDFVSFLVGFQNDAA